MYSKGLILVRSRIVRCSSAIATVMYMNYVVNVCIMRMQEIANSYKYMYENCAGGLLDALVIVQYMHVLYNMRCARDRSLSVGKWR